MKKVVDRFKNRVQNFKINFKKKFKESKEKPKSKRKSFILGVTTAVGIFGFTLFGPALLAVAKDLPKGNPKPTDIAPAPVPALPPSNEIVNAGLSGASASVCALAITSGSFAMGIVCGCIIVVGILHLEGKYQK
jgi:hypothetical protein